MPSNDVDHPTNTKNPLYFSNGSITRPKAKVLKKALNGQVVQVSAKTEPGDSLEHQKEALVHLIHMQDGPNPHLFGL